MSWGDFVMLNCIPIRLFSPEISFVSQDKKAATCPRLWMNSVPGLELNTNPAHHTQVPLHKSVSYFFYIKALEIILTAQTCTDGAVEKPGHIFPPFLLSFSIQQHWLDEHFEFLYQINFPLLKKKLY